MIGQSVGSYLDTLDKAAEDRVLTSKLAPGFVVNPWKGGARCLLGATEDWQYTDGCHRPMAVVDDDTSYLRRCSLALRFDRLCERIGTDKASDLIRSRILVNQLRRSVAQARAVNELVAAR